MKTLYFFLIILLSICLTACHSNPPPRHPNNICSVFRQYPRWYWASKKTQKKWHIPISVQMAIIHEESHFRAEAQPMHQKLLGVIPWFRPTTASGYTQALDETWREYLKSEGRLSAGRDDFSDATDFIGWYSHIAYYKLGIARWNARSLYLAYHEGIDGYRNKTYIHKPWLIKIADKVQRYATRYHRQLKYCEGYLPKKPWWEKFF